MSNDTTEPGEANNPQPQAPPDVMHASVWRQWPVGQRVMVRATLIDDAHHRYTDHLGVIVATSEAGLTLDTRRGEVIIPAHQIAIGKPVPPPPPRRRPRTIED